jgi:predicted DNA-binding transcriptional regulator YafY
VSGAGGAAASGGIGNPSFRQNRRMIPLGLVLKGVAWYAVADAHRGRRVFRVSRFERVSMRAETFSRPSSFDLAAFWTEWSVSFAERLPQLEVTLRVRRDHLRYLRSAVAPSGQATIDAIDAGSDGDRVTVVVPFDGVGYAQSQLLGFGTAVEVLSPRDFRERLADTAHEIAAMYDGSTSDAN